MKIMSFFTTKYNFLLSSIFIVLMDFPVILIVYSIHFVIIKTFIDIIIVAASLLFPKRIYAIIFLSIFTLFETFNIFGIGFNSILLICIVAGFCIVPKLTGYMIAYKKK